MRKNNAAHRSSAIESLPAYRSRNSKCMNLIKPIDSQRHSLFVAPSADPFTSKIAYCNNNLPLLTQSYTRFLYNDYEANKSFYNQMKVKYCSPPNIPNILNKSKRKRKLLIQSTNFKNEAAAQSICAFQFQILNSYIKPPFPVNKANTKNIDSNPEQTYPCISFLNINKQQNTVSFTSTKIELNIQYEIISKLKDKPDQYKRKNNYCFAKPVSFLQKEASKAEYKVSVNNNSKYFPLIINEGQVSLPLSLPSKNNSNPGKSIKSPMKTWLCF